MNKILFKYGVMGCGKSLELIRGVYNYRERGMEVLVYKSKIDIRDSIDKCKIVSRTGAKINAKWLPKDKNIYNIIKNDIIANDKKISAIFIDEVQFLNEEQINDLQKINFEFNIPILCYGLLTDFTSHLFEGSKRLLEIADDYQEIIAICHCGRRAKQNARVVNGKIVKTGEQIILGKNNTDGKNVDVYYVALCNKCYNDEIID